jgi:hypothetical protein
MMKFEKIKLTNLVITFTKQELVILSNAIHETLTEIEEWEFFTRTGTETGEARMLLERIKGIMQSSGEKDEFRLEISGLELRILHSSLGEVTAGFHLENFEQRIGVSKKVARFLSEQMHNIFGH